MLEAQEFAEHDRGRAPARDRSAFLSSFFAARRLARAACHAPACLWLGTMMAQVFVKGFRADILRRLLCFNLFWHALDIIWVALFTVVYLIGVGPMSDHPHDDDQVDDVGARLHRRADEYTVREGIQGYVIGLVLATLLTVASFYVVERPICSGRRRIPIALVVLAIAQMGVHLVFFLHITTAPDNTNNVLALAFGVLIVALVIAGSLWIMDNLNHNMMPMDQMMQMQR